MRKYSLEEISQHATNGDAWIVVGNDVFDVSSFAKFHPGGESVLMKLAGKDVSYEFSLYHNQQVLEKYTPRLKIGELATPKPENNQIDFPFGNPMWYSRFKSPYHKETHFTFRDRVRKFMQNQLFPSLDSWKDKPAPPQEIYEQFGSEGFIVILSGARPWPSQYLPAHVNSKKPDDLDYFHEAILLDELARCGHAGAINALTNGAEVAVSPIFYFGSESLKSKFLPDLLTGKKFAALAITEPQTGSDVAAIETVAVTKGNHFEVTGNKKYITNGFYADVFITAVKTSSGRDGISLIAIERDCPGFSIRKMKFRESNVTGTSYLDFNHCLVPRDNLIGVLNQGFRQIMWNFNHERMYYVCVALRLARVCLEESIRFAIKRKTFGKALHEHQTLRMKVASMIRHIESLQAWFELVAYQLTWMSHEEANKQLGDIICLMKAESAKVYELCARETTQIFGGNALYCTGVGAKIEPAVLQVKSYQIPAGGEDVLDDYGARSTFRRARAHL